MPLSALQIASVSPRGGPSGTVIVIVGANFGPPTGQILFNPEGGAGGPLAAAITSWAPTSITATVPVGLSANRAVSLQVVNGAGLDSASVPFWVPSAAPGPGDTLDYAYPVEEAGSPTQDVDDPRVWKAAGFNRLLDRFKALHSGDPTPTTSNKNMTASVTPVDGSLACAAPLAFAPANAAAALHGSEAAVFVNGVKYYVAKSNAERATSPCYFSGDGGATARAAAALVAGDLLYWNGSVAGFKLDANDRIDFVYLAF